MKTETFKSEIVVQKYEFGKPFPSLYGQFENIAKLPKEAQIKLHGVMGDYYIGEGGMNGKFGIVLTETQGFVLVADGAYMQVSGSVATIDQYHQPTCIGRVPLNYKPEKSS